jgi:hypothetical protein
MPEVPRSIEPRQPERSGLLKEFGTARYHKTYQAWDGWHLIWRKDDQQKRAAPSKNVYEVITGPNVHEIWRWFHGNQCKRQSLD